MNSISTREVLLQKIAQIQQMERGKLCVIRHGPHGPFYNLQSWENGRNVTRYVPRDQVAILEADIKAYEQFQALVEEYAQLVINQTRAIRGRIKQKEPTPTLLINQDKKSNGC